MKPHLIARPSVLRRFIGTVVVGMVLASCGSTNDTATTTTSVASTTTVVTTTTPAPTTTTVVEQFPVAELEAQIQTVVDRWRTEAGIPGAALVVSLPDGSEVSITSGVRDLTTNEPVRSDEYWRIASITKPMVSAVVLRLAERGLVDLSAPVAQYLGTGWAQGYELNGVDYGDVVTIADVLAHTDGFKEYAFDPGFYLLVSDRLDVPMTPDEVVAWAVGEGPQFVPGTGYLYNTIGHVVAGLVIEAVTGLPAEQVLRDELFIPAKVADLYLTPREFPPARVPAGYVQGLLRMALDLIPGLAAYSEQATVGDFYDVTAVPQAVLTSAPFTGGGLEAQLDDVALVFRALFDGTLLTPASVEAFTTTVLDTNYGLGISVDQVDDLTVYSHGGGVPGFRSHALYSPDLDVAMAISSNLIPLDPDVGTVANEVLRLVRATIEG
jgi:D-alanyl-D-alanine carboxypeptidase